MKKASPQLQFEAVPGNEAATTKSITSSTIGGPGEIVKSLQFTLPRSDRPLNSPDAYMSDRPGNNLGEIG